MPTINATFVIDTQFRGIVLLCIYLILLRECQVNLLSLLVRVYVKGLICG